ncbi:MAG: UDP-4-amino-4,6-dideoxy-N-acetyl-beta-L-altrosamine transaminase [Desulfobacterales bacterium]|jgi:perosamine synthetase
MQQAFKKSHPIIPYGRQWIDEQDIQTVVDTLRSDWLTTGPKVGEFEQAVADYVGAKYAVAVNSGTAALHAAMYAIGVGPGEEVILPPMTFAATANCVVFQGATPVFADVDPGTLLIDPTEIESKITARTKAVIAVDYAGQPCDYDALKHIAERHDLIFVADACHSLGAKFKEENVGTLADLSVFSFHPVKHITTGEGGMVTTSDPKLAERMRVFRNHGITTEHHQREAQDSWFYEMTDLGYNYRITDFQCSLGMSQLAKLPGWIARRQEIASRYNDEFAEISGVAPLEVKDCIFHAYHLYVVKLDLSQLKVKRSEIFSALRAEKIGANVHYIPVHLHPFYRNNFNTRPGLCPAAEAAYERILSLPIYPAMKDSDVQRVVAAVSDAMTTMRKEAIQTNRGIN